MKTPQDWAQELVDELEANNMVGDDCTCAFVECYRENGDTLDAWMDFESKADFSEQFDPNCYMLLIFNDGSCFASWKEGIDKFYPNISDLEDEDNEVAERLALN
jgi:hypothetical protein